MKQDSESHFVARQPIFDNQSRLFAYELLYRNSEQNSFPKQVSDEVASGRVIFDSVLLHNIEKLANGRPIFINLSTQGLISQLPCFTDPKEVVIEITERTECKPEVHHAIRRLKQRKYKFALDDYDGAEKWDELVEEVDFIKLEVETPLTKTLEQVQKVKAQHKDKKIIVERIEDYETFHTLKEAGCDYFQGYFFKRPEMLKLKSIHPKHLTALKLISKANSASFDIQKIKEEIEKDVGLTVRLLKLANNICRMGSDRLTSVRHALLYIGEDMVRQFIKLISLSLLNLGKPSELFSVSLFRARFISLMLIEEDKKTQESGYLVGLVSLLDAILDVKIDVILPELGLSQACVGALKDHSGKLGEALLLCKKIEINDWTEVEALTANLDTKLLDVIEAYREAIYYADNIVKSTRSAP